MQLRKLDMMTEEHRSSNRKLGSHIWQSRDVSP